MTEFRYTQHPFSCVQDAVEKLETVVFWDEGARNEFFLKVRPFLAHCIGLTLRASQVWLRDVEREDLESTVNLYLLEKWFPRLKRWEGNTPQRVIAYLRKTIDGLVRVFIEEMFQRFSREPFDHVNEPEAWFVRVVDFRLDREALRQEAERQVERYLRMRGRATEVRDVVERMVRVIFWKRYEGGGQLFGARGWDTPRGAPGVVPV